MHSVNSVMPWMSGVALLALLLLAGAVMHADITRRRIPNSFCASIAILGLIHALAQGGWSGFGDIVLRLGVAALIGIPLGLLFALRALGGGDVKLLLALVLWVEPEHLPALFAITVLAGGIIAIGITMMRRVFCFRGPDGIPYGLAIVIAGLVVILPDVEASAAAVCTHMI
jgi:prepilin peptidase CpaA